MLARETGLLLNACDNGWMRWRRALRTKAGEQCFKARTIRLGNREELHAEAVAAFNVANNRVGIDAALFDKKIQLGGHALLEGEVLSLDKQARRRNVQDSRDIVTAIASPANPDVVRGREAKQSAAGIGRLVVHDNSPKRRRKAGSERQRKPTFTPD